MRAIFVLWLVACASEGLPPGGGSDGGARDLSHASDLASSSRTDLKGIDLAGPPSGETCVSSCNRCGPGPCCGSVCCNSGEWCDATFTCRCGSGAACPGNLNCASGGPIMQGAQCGAICCGDSSHPCPL